MSIEITLTDEECKQLWFVCNNAMAYALNSRANQEKAFFFLKDVNDEKLKCLREYWDKETIEELAIMQRIKELIK